LWPESCQVVGKERVLCIDADFSTRGLSLLLLSSLIDTGDLDPPPYSCLAESVLARTPVEKLQPLTVAFGSIEFNVLVSNRNLRQGGIPEDRLLGSTGEGGTSHLVDLPVQEYFSYLQSLCDVMRNSFDYIVIDTRGGFDTTSVVPAIVSDSYCIVLEADEISVQQVYGLKTKIDEYAQRLKGPNRLKGFIVNKALYAPSDKGFVSNVARIYGGQALGTVPADKLAIKAYQKKHLALDVAPESDFAYYAFDVINNLVSDDQAKWTKTETSALADLGRNIRRRWRLRNRLEKVQIVNPYVALALLILTALSYLVATRTYNHLALVSFYVIAATTALWCVAVVCLTLFARIRESDLFKSKKWVNMVVLEAVVLLFGGIAYLALVDVPRTASNDVLIQTLTNQSKQIADQGAQLREAPSKLDQTQAELMITKSGQTKTRPILIERRWSAYQDVGCDATNSQTVIASVPLDPNYQEQVLSVRASVDDSANLSSQDVAVLGNSGNQAQIRFALNGLKRNLLNCPGGGHANIVVVFNILRQAPTSKLLPFAISGSFAEGYTFSADSSVTVDTTSGLVVSANITVVGTNMREAFVAAPVFNSNSMWQWQNQGSLRGSLDLQEKDHSFTNYSGGLLTHSAYWTPTLGRNIASTNTYLKPIPSSETIR
jgi:hypothetical protein